MCPTKGALPNEHRTLGLARRTKGAAEDTPQGSQLRTLRGWHAGNSQEQRRTQQRADRRRAVGILELGDQMDCRPAHVSGLHRLQGRFLRRTREVRPHGFGTQRLVSNNRKARFTNARGESSSRQAACSSRTGHSTVGCSSTIEGRNPKDGFLTSGGSLHSVKSGPRPRQSASSSPQVSSLPRSRSDTS